MITAKATKENAVELISFYFSKVTKEVDNNSLRNNNFYIYEHIAKGYALYYVNNDDRFNENQKKEMIKIINEL
jgi:hypothetical protein